MSRRIILIAVALTLVACGPTVEQQVVGKWDGGMSSPTTPPNTPLDSIGQAFAQGAMAVVRPTLDVRADKTYTMTLGVTLEGTWDVDGHELTLNRPTKVAGIQMNAADTAPVASPVQPQPNGNQARPQDQPMRFELSTDGKTLTPVGSTQVFVFTKEVTGSQAADTLKK
jgi:hypothetical protein